MANSKKEPRWIGDKDLTQRPDSPQIEYGVEEWTITRQWEGPWERCRKARKRKGARLLDEASWTYVHSSSVQKLPGGRGLLTIVAKRRAGSKQELEEERPDPDEDQKDEEEDGGDRQNREPIVEIEWLRIEKPLGTHPMFAELTPTQWGQIKAWEAGEVNHPDRYGQFQYQTGGSGNWTALTGLALKYAEKILRGVTGYMVFTPIVRWTHYFSSRPNTGRCGKRSSPANAPAGYEWLKTADRAIRQEGQWTRVQEWTGADEWDKDLYEE